MIAKDLDMHGALLAGTPSPLQGEGSAQRRMRGRIDRARYGENPSPALRAPSPSRGVGNGAEPFSL